MYTSIRGR